ncbi:MAG: hypothetical protein D6689_05615 [Deltaproteobacteria bacterium]|nr:MAG: hypothetical protein D6689_05615 [Deltaproteobacteria bacterium]
MQCGGFWMAAGLTVVAGACSFDPTAPGLPSRTGPDATAGGGDSDAGLPDAASRPPADAEPPPPEEGVARSVRGTPDVSDARFEEWAGVPAYEFRMGDAADYHGRAGYTPSARLTFASMHDDEHVYFALQVTDDQVVEGGSPLWTFDSVTLYLDAGGDRAGQLGADDHEITIGANAMYSDFTPSDPRAKLSGTARRTADGYALEIGVRIDSLADAPMPSTIGFDIAINDNDGSSDAAFGLWYVNPGPHCEDCCEGWSHPEPWCDTTVFGRLILE